MHPPRPPEPPQLRDEDIAAIVAWLRTTAAWLQEEQRLAGERGQADSADMLRNQRLYQDATLLFQEAYDFELD